MKAGTQNTGRSTIGHDGYAKLIATERVRIPLAISYYGVYGHAPAAGRSTTTMWRTPGSDS